MTGHPAQSESTYLDWAEAMVEPLRSRAAETERLRELPPATLVDAEAAGLLRMVMPSELGGDSAGLATLAHMTRVLAHGCVSSAWTLSFLAMHNWLIARGPRDLRTAVFGDGGVARIPCPLAPTGTARPVEGGYVVSGRWEWATGVQHADWVMVHAIVERDDELETRFVVVPIDDVVVEDVWHTSGMRGTGSNTVVVDELFVPVGRTIDAPAMFDDPPGAALSEHSLVGYPLVPVLAIVAAAPALGGAEAAVDLFRERLRTRILAYSSGDRQIEQPSAQIRLAEALATVRAARLVWEDAIARIVTAEAGPPIGDVDRGGIRLATAHVVRLSIQAVETVLEGAGASVHFEDSPLQRISRDLLTLRGHAIFDWDRAAQVAGKLELGLERGPTDIL